MPKYLFLLVLSVVIAACSNPYKQTAETLKTTFNAESCAITKIEDAGSYNRPRKEISIWLTKPKYSPYELDKAYFASTVALKASELLDKKLTEGLTTYKVTLADSAAEHKFSFSISGMDKAKFFIQKADTFVQSYCYSDTLKFESMLNLRYMSAFDAVGSMMQPQMLQDSLGIAKQFKLLGYDYKKTENGNYVYAVRYAAVRKGKVHDIYDINIGAADTLVSGYSWMLP